MVKYNKDKTAIVYLAMNTKRDVSYGRDSRSMLENSLDTLYENYNNEFKHDIIIFYDSKAPFLESDIVDITKDRKEIRFQLIPDSLWCPPECEELKNNPDPKSWVRPKFSVGYRNMMRWYGILIYKYLTDLGYEWYMRMDDDSFLHSKIEYDLFKFMHDNDYEYGFRVYINDHISGSQGLIEFCNSYCETNNIVPKFLNRYGKHNKLTTTKNHNITGYYNNFLISKLSFWMRKDVQNFLKSYDNSGYQYTRRWNDLISQAVTIQMFMDRHKVYQFNDWCYEHATFGNYNSKTHLEWGGVFPAIKDGEIVSNDYILKWKDDYGAYNKHSIDIRRVRDCLKALKNVDLACCQIPQTEGFAPLNNDDCYFIGSYETLDEVYFAIEDYWVNCSSSSRGTAQFTYPSPLAFVWYKGSNHNWFCRRLYVINNMRLINPNYNSVDTLSFDVKKSLIL